MINSKKCKQLENNISNKSRIIIYKNKGKFYNALGIDAFIISYLTGYKVVNNNKVGFPDVALNKIINLLNDKKVSYEIVYEDKNPEICDYKKINKYDFYLEKAKEHMDMSKKISLINNYITNASNDKLEKLLQVISDFFK